jgi:hypothetical protein
LFRAESETLAPPFPVFPGKNGGAWQLWPSHLLKTDYNQMANSGNVMVLFKTSLDTHFIVVASPDVTIASLKSMVYPLNR